MLPRGISYRVGPLKAEERSQRRQTNSLLVSRRLLDGTSSTSVGSLIGNPSDKAGQSRRHDSEEMLGPASTTISLDEPKTTHVLEDPEGALQRDKGQESWHVNATIGLHAGLGGNKSKIAVMYSVPEYVISAYSRNNPSAATIQTDGNCHIGQNLGSFRKPPAQSIFTFPRDASSSSMR